jgi:glycosyltransferase involved in cell wall biosynthesis
MEGDMMAPTPLLSVTVLNYNYAQYLPVCLDSILGQTFRDFELIIINDCSKDNSLEVLQPYRSDPRVRLVDHQVNKGFVASLIEGTDLSRGKYVTVISADDYCISSLAFARLIEMMESEDTPAFAYSAYGQYGDDGVCRYVRRTHPSSYIRSGLDEFHDLALDPYILHSGAIIRRSAYQAVDGYDPRARYAVDVKMWLLLCSQGTVAYCADELYAYRMHESNMSHSRAAMEASLSETLDGIDASFALLGGRLNKAESLRRRAIQAALVAIPTDDIFAGRLRRGWYGYSYSLRKHPFLTVFQAKTAILLVRTALGERGFNIMRSYAKRQSRGHAAAAREQEFII